MLFGKSKITRAPANPVPICIMSRQEVYLVRASVGVMDNELTNLGRVMQIRAAGVDKGTHNSGARFSINDSCGVKVFRVPLLNKDFNGNWVAASKLRASRVVVDEPHGQDSDCAPKPPSFWLLQYHARPCG